MEETRSIIVNQDETVNNTENIFNEISDFIKSSTEKSSEIQTYNNEMLTLPMPEGRGFLGKIL